MPSLATPYLDMHYLIEERFSSSAVETNVCEHTQLGSAPVAELILLIRLDIPFNEKICESYLINLTQPVSTVHLI